MHRTQFTIELRRLFPAIVAAIALSACSSAPPKNENLSVQQMYQRAHRQEQQNNYQKALDDYNALEARYPFGAYATRAQVEQVYLNFKTGDYQSAISAANRYIQEHPRDKNLDYVYYMKGLSSFDQAVSSLEGTPLGIDHTRTDPKYARQGFQTLQTLVKKFPDSPYAPDARKRLVFLRNRLARHDWHIAHYYYRRRAWLAAANRAVEIITKYQGTPEVPRALGLMVHSYEHLGLKQMASDARHVLQASFPHQASRVLAETG
ncbi:MAG TPA: outer membrane protein assembly factor BamD [Gammaproteobacteria bacterium]|nr:outer membrane protein assembly factor BamD [Gammaproteobacteria bacterium]